MLPASCRLSVMQRDREDVTTTSRDDGGGDGEATREPLSLGVRQFVASRMAEITSLTAQLGGTGSAGARTRGFAFQHVSKHMRRRAVSHNPKRLPTRLRMSHLAQLRKSSGGFVRKPKCPRKKYRNRPVGDILEYNRRQLVNPKWLESHIWHAKRFHVKSMWNRKIAIAPTAKCFRSLFRAARDGVIMHDISYLSTMEIEGPKDIVIEGMSKLLPEEFSKVVQFNKEFLGNVICASTSKHIGPIKYMWMPGNDTRAFVKLLIWIHPVIKSFVMEEILRMFDLGEQKLAVEFPEFPTKDEKKYLWKIVSNQNWSNNTTEVTMKDLGGCFNRIRLIGPKTLTVLKEILKVGQLNITGVNDPEQVEEQSSCWKNLQKVANVPDGAVIPLNVIDPRLELPKKRSSVKKIVVEDKSEDTMFCDENWLKRKMNSVLWCDQARKILLRNKTPDHKLCWARNKNLIPGTAINEEIKPDVVPIALVFRSYNSTFPGVDLILPCGWLMPFWIALSYRCVRSYALEFDDYITFEDNPFYLDFSTSSLLSPDNIAYCSENEKAGAEVRVKYFSYPPAKRHNLIKLGCAFPFCTDWVSFLQFSFKDVNLDTPVSLTVLRSREDLRNVADCLRNLNVTQEIFSNPTALYPVRVVLLSGAVEKGACICLPTKSDLALLLSRRHTDVHIIQEGFKDSNTSKRAELSRLHHKRLSKLRKKRKVARRAARDLNKSFDIKSILEQLDSKAAVEKYNQEMNSLWLDDNAEQILAQQDRDVIGFTEYAHFSYVRGQSTAIGYVAIGKLKRLMEIFKEEENSMKRKLTLHVLVRNWASSFIYHWARLEFPTSL